MTTVYVESCFGDDERRRRLYDGDIFVFGPRPSTLRLIEHARGMLEDAFAGVDPRSAQYDMPVERYVEIGAELKPRFIHHETTARLITAVLEELACDLQTTYQDVPRLRMVTSDGYLTSGIGYAHHPHRDMWYSAPSCQLNWWLPIYELDTSGSMAFNPGYWETEVENGSAEFDYYEWNAVGRREAAEHITSDTRKQPKPSEPLQLEPDLRLITPPGGVLLFSAHHLHSTVTNQSGAARYSIDFRTVDLDDLSKGVGSLNLDAFPHGTSLRDFRRASDLSDMPHHVVAKHDDGDARGGELVFSPPEC